MGSVCSFLGGVCGVLCVILLLILTRFLASYIHQLFNIRYFCWPLGIYVVLSWLSAAQHSSKLCICVFCFIGPFVPVVTPNPKPESKPKPIEKRVSGREAERKPRTHYRWN
ncbi:hypothetical protein BKA64DRAFT_686657 [Cadophora sp. MPI-SDFR-AT-0126]|nr:hypothetical protein BKA64DRAFT_686657 [Leotiomycetes sp. MPI-SDFR-AT-0126]